MSYQALYRKFRPVNFDEVVGQEHLITTLKNQVKSGKISHAYLFTGTRGTGKTSTAKIFARAINCLNNIEGSPCNKCANCVELSSPSCMDILEIDAASNNRVDEIREIREQAAYLPVNAKYKVYIIDEVHMLTDSAFNALLKTLEEPPSHVVFVLATTEVHKLPATILSRCMRFDLKLIDAEILEKLIQRIYKESNISATAEAIKLIAKAGEGSARDAISIADMCAASASGEITYQCVLEATGASSPEIMLNMLEAVIHADVEKLLNISSKISSMGKNINVVLKDLNNYFRNLIIIKTSKNANEFLNLPKDIYETLEKLSVQIEIKKITEILEKLGVLEQNLKYTVNAQILFEASLINLMLAETQSETTEKKTVNNTSQQFDARKIWASVLKEIKKFSSPIMFAVLGEIIDVKLEENNFVLSVNTETYKFITKDIHYKKLVEVFRLKNYNFNIIINQLTEQDESTKTINKLSEIFGNKLQIK